MVSLLIAIAIMTAVSAVLAAPLALGLAVLTSRRPPVWTARLGRPRVHPVTSYDVVVGPTDALRSTLINFGLVEMKLATTQRSLRIPIGRTHIAHIPIAHMSVGTSADVQLRERLPTNVPQYMMPPPAGVTGTSARISEQSLNAAAS